MAELSNDSNFLSDVYSSAKELITERFSSPFIFSYVISWLLINYKAVILIFTDTTENFQINTKIDLIEAYIEAAHQLPLFQDGPSFNSFVLAFFVACFYTFAYPFGDYWITQFTLNRKVSIRNLRVKAESTIVHSAEYVDKIYLRHARAEKDLRARLEGAEITENQLRAVIKDLEEKLNQDIKVKSSESEVKTTSEPIEVDTKLELAKAYIGMDDVEGAEELLEEVMVEGNANQLKRAKTLYKKLEAIKVSKSANIETPVKNEPANKLTKDQLAIIDFLGEFADRGAPPSKEDEIRAHIGQRVTTTRLALEELVSSSYVSKSKNNNLQLVYELTSKGLKEFVEMHESRNK